MKILVTGGNGFLGSWIVRALAENGHKIRVLHRSSSDMSSLRGIEYESVLGDVTDESSMIAAAAGQEVVFHAAAMISYSPSEKKLMEKINVEGTANVCRACVKNGVQRLVHTSSVVAVGGSFKKKILNEESAFELQPYGLGYYETKRRAEQVVRDAVKAHKLDAVIVNPSIMFGAGDAVKGSRKTHLKVAAGKFHVYPKGGCNIMHVADAVGGHLRALEKGRSGERYILGGENVYIKDLFKMLAEAGGHEPPKIPLPSSILRGAFLISKQAAALGAKMPPTDSAFLSTLFHWYDISKAKKELGLDPRPARGAIFESVKWARENGCL